MFKSLFKPHIKKVNEIEVVFKKNKKWFDKIDKDTEIDGVPLICCMSKKEEYLEIVGLLIKKGVDLNRTVRKYHPFEFLPGENALHIASRYGNISIVSALLSSDIHINIQSDDVSGCKTPLIEACSLEISPHFLKNLGESEKIAKILLDKKANPNIQDINGWSALHWCNNTTVENLGSVQLLIEYGADINLKNNNGATPLWLAAQNNLVGTARLLISKGAIVDSKNVGGHTPFELACIYGKMDMVKLLLENGADINAKDNEGQTPLFCASANGYSEIVNLLEKCGAKIE